MMMYDRGTVSKGLVVANLVMAVITLIMCGALVFRAGEIDLWNHDDDGDKRPAVRCSILLADKQNGCAAG